MFNNLIERHHQVFSRLPSLAPIVESAAHTIAESLKYGAKVMFCGNGGSAADSQHIAAEFVGRFVNDRPPLSALALSTDTSAITCIGNDYDFDQIFVRQLLALGRAGDVLVGISTSGNSGNVLEAIRAAKDKGIYTIGLLGRDGGKLAKLVDCPIIVPSDETARIQEAHIFIGHALCGLVESNLGY